MILILTTAALMATGPAKGADGVLRRVSDVAAAVREQRFGATFEIDAVATSPIQDGTNLVFVASDDRDSVIIYQEPEIALKTIKPGTRIKASGIIKRYNDVSAIGAALALKISITGETHVPPTTEAKLSDIVDGKFDMRYVKATGVVKAKFPDTIDANFFFLVLVGDNASLHISLHAQQTAGNADTIPYLIGAKVSVCGIVQNDPSGSRRHFRPLLGVNAMDDFKIMHPFNPNDDSIPMLGDMKDIRPDLISTLGPHKAAGTVVAIWQKGSKFLLKTDAGKFSKVDLLEGVEPPACGDRAMVFGFPDTDLFNINLLNARWKRLESAEAVRAFEEPTNVTARTLMPRAGKNDIISSSNFGKAISLEGVVRSLPAKESNDERMMLESEGLIMPIDATSCPEALSGLSIGCRVRVAGIFIFEADSWRANSIFPNVTDVAIVARRADDIRVISRPSWWTPSRLLIVIGVLVVIIVVVLLWNSSLRILAERRGQALYRARMEKTASEMRVNERTRLATELHDYISQDMTAISYQVTAARRAHGVDPDECAAHLDTADRMLGSCRTELRRCLWDLRNEALDEQNVAKAVETSIGPIVGDAATDIKMDIPRESLDDSTMHAMLSIVRELVANAIKHGHANLISIKGEVLDGTLVLTVSDDGIGFDASTMPGAAEGHFGLAGVHERALQHGGGSSIDSVPGGGTRITVSFKL